MHITLKNHNCNTASCHTSAKSQAWSLAPSSSHCFCGKQKAKVSCRYTIHTQESSKHVNNTAFDCYSIKLMHLHQKRQCKTQYASLTHTQHARTNARTHARTHTSLLFGFVSSHWSQHSLHQDATGVGFPVSLLLPCSALSTSMILAYLRGDTF